MGGDWPSNDSTGTGSIGIVGFVTTVSSSCSSIKGTEVVFIGGTCEFSSLIDNASVVEALPVDAYGVG